MAEVGGDGAGDAPLRLRIRMSRKEIQGRKTASSVDDGAVRGVVVMAVDHRRVSVGNRWVLGLELVVRTRC